MLVLGATMLLTVLGLAAISVSRLERTVAAEMLAANDARLGSASGLEVGVAAIEGDLASRLRMDAVLVDGVDVGRATLTVRASDAVDGDLTNSEQDPVTVDSTAVVDGLTFVTTAAFDPVFVASPRLAYGVSAEGGIAFSSATAFSSSGFFSGGDVAAATSTVTGEVRAAGAVRGSTYASTTTGGVDTIKVVDETVFTTWAASATRITLASIPNKRIRDVVLGPNANPYGVGNPSGIYIIDCAGSDIEIRDARIVGTLILIDSGPGSAIREAVTMEPARADAPTLLVKGKMTFAMTGVDLAETLANVNMNPAGVAYDGVTDTDKTDVYASVIAGLVYVSDNVVTSGVNSFDGVLMVGGTLQVGGTLTVWHQTSASTPRGFQQFSNWSMDAATLKRTVE